jgi:hypothetical protein
LNAESSTRMYFSRSLATLPFALLLSLFACRQDMHDQPRFEPLEANPVFADGRSARPHVPGTIARGRLQTDKHFFAGKSEKKAPEPTLFPVTEEELERTLTRLAGERLAETFPYPVTRAMIDRGRSRFEIFCSPCHGRLGDGGGIVVTRGFRRPPSYHIDRLLQAPVGHFFDVITNGLGAMADFSDRVSPSDRWAIVAYIRALQLSQHARLPDLPASVREEFQRRVP